jgi:S-DNA-T family DNA segregation ATPase FtsK/SpoIIIE
MEADTETRVAEIASAIARHVRGQMGATSGGTVVSLLSHRQDSQPPPLYVAGRLVDATDLFGESSLIDGCVVSLDDPRLAIAPEPDGLVELRIVSGQGAGVVHRLGIGELTIGSDLACTIVVNEAEVPAVAVIVIVNLDGTVELRSAAHTDDAIALDREPVPADGIGWPFGKELQVGNVLIELHQPSRPDAALLPSLDGPWLDYNRPPRLLPPARKTTFRLPQKPSEPTKTGMPILGMLTPALFGVAMAVVLKNPLYLMMAAMTPLMMIGNAISSRRQGKKSHRQLLREHREHIEAIEVDASDALIAERRARRDASPDPAELLVTAVGPRARLWERRRTDPDYLLVRIGTSDLPSEVTVEDPEQLEHRRQVKRVASDVPVAVSLRGCGVLGIAGRSELPRQVATWIVGQLAVLQSPRDVQIYLLTDRNSEQAWRWTGWLPHLRPHPGCDVMSLIGSDTDSLSRRVGELGQIVAARQKAFRERGGAVSFDDPDIVVVLDGARRLRALPGVVSLLKEGPVVGVFCLCIDSDERLLPEECGAVILETTSGLELRQQRADDIADVRADLVPAAWFQQVCRALAPIRDVSDSDEDGALPSSCRLLDVLSLDPPTSAAIAARWRLGGSSTEAVIGASIDGPFSIDLRRDGPHGLIAGTTGSGKSELLQTIVASLAVANRPDAMTFVLVDYKGGAAFKDCEHLPHTVGMVTDLDTHLVERALTSLAAELTRREHILAGAGAKDIEDYADYSTRDASLAALPRLLIVIDEFASMARELPDFVAGLVNIAQRGRSLGIHLILATQRPTGVVSPEIRANTNLRIALRVTDPAESSDVIDVPEAARISKTTPGRGYVRLGHASLVPFQAGRVGGRRPGAIAVTREPPWLSTVEWSQLGQLSPRPPKDEQPDDLEMTDLAVLVQEIVRANEAMGLSAQHSPWLAALPELLTTDDLAAPEVAAANSRVPLVPYALEDLPAEQRQRVASIDFDQFGHLFIVGAPRSGRSQALRTIAAMIARHTSSADVHLFGIDCGNGGLIPLAKLPHCGAVAQRTQTERATRLLGRLMAEMLRRQEVLGAGSFADLTEQRAAAAPADRLPHLMLLVDRWEGFTATLGEIDGGELTDQVWMMLREGASAGIHLVISGDRSMLTGRISSLAEDKLVLRLTDRGDYSLAGLNPRNLPDEVAQGRAFRADSGIETQIAVLDSDRSGAAQVEAIGRIGAAAAERDADVPRFRRPFRVDVLPSRLAFDDAWAKREDDVKRPLWGLVGVGGDDLLALGPDLAAGPATFVVAGPPKSGRSTVLASMVESFLKCGTEVVIWAPRASPLRELAGQPGVVTVLTEDDLDEATLKPLVMEGDGPLAFVIDDAEMLKEIAAKDWMRTYIRTAGDHNRAMVIAGNATEVCSGFSGWQMDIKKNRNGALLSPQDFTDGDIVGVRVPRSTVGGPVQPGRALLHLGTGELITVQVPVLPH